MAFSPEVLPAAVNAITNSPGRQRPVVLITCDADGRPRVCVPDWGDLRAVDDRHLRVAVWPSDPTAANLDRDASALLIVTIPSDVYVVNATARLLEGAAMVWAHYELTITSAGVADRGTVPRPRSESDAEAGWEVLAQRPSKADGAPAGRAPALEARRRTSPQRSPWARPPGPGGKGEHRCTEGARP
ncbi:hypothetical protein [Actinomadura fibrosa]|uniref:Pyridoxamine 5'-phosphate oxidase putative domain-containing protein n=1 Tax=Actinomadura fibrosa TaxID=111802 RepID=A0ABW2XN69_9ACTN|nr:hypothetical protein [Actinomadura fibrosa]